VALYIIVSLLFANKVYMAVV